MQYNYGVVGLENKKLVSLRVPAGLAAFVEDYAENQGISKTDAYVRFLEVGIESIQEDSDQSRLKRIEEKLDALISTEKHA